MEKTRILGECKWSPKEMGPEILAALHVKTASVGPGQGNWRILYVGMAHGGWSASAQLWANEIWAVPSGKNWQATSAVLVDLAKVDADFARWNNI